VADDALLPGVTEPGPKAFRAGTHRLVSPEETLACVGRLMPVMGITRIANVTGLDTLGVPVVAVYRPNARSLAVAQGKGLTLAAAKASGLMESMEIYHAENIAVPLLLGSHEGLRYTRPIVDVGGLAHLDGSLFHPERRMLWIEGHDVLQRRPAWVPYEVVHTDFTLPQPSGAGCFVSSSTGLASGNHVLEAVSHGICEVVERDAFTLWGLLGNEGKRRTRVDLATVDDPDCRSVLDRFARAGVRAAVWEATSDVGLAVFRCVIADGDLAPMRRTYASGGLGCHPTRRIALLRALTEAAQSRLTMISGARDDLTRDEYEHTRSPDVTARVRALLAEEGARSFRDAPDHEGETFAEDVAWQLGCLTRVGVREVVVIDLEKPALRVPVVRVVIPGMEAYDRAPGYTPGARAQALLERARQGGQA
jgi:ribosomal protein S12 methylthiotransferase accessory factor